MQLGRVSQEPVRSDPVRADPASAAGAGGQAEAARRRRRRPAQLARVSAGRAADSGGRVIRQAARDSQGVLRTAEADRRQDSEPLRAVD